MHALRVPARGHAHHAQPATAAHRALRVHAVHGRRARWLRRPAQELGDAHAGHGRRHRAPHAQAQDVLRDGVRRVLREHVRHVQGDAGEHGQGRHQAGHRQACR